MQPLDLNVLTLILALSVYVSSIRFLVLGRLFSIADSAIETDIKKKEAYKTFLRSLVPADFAFVVSGFFLFMMLFQNLLFGSHSPCFLSPNCLAPFIIWVFFLGIFT